MQFSQLSEFFSKLENTASRNEMTLILADLFKKSSQEEIGYICYLLQGRVLPLFEPIEFGLADKMMIKAIARAYGKKEEEVNSLFKKRGDLGITGQELGIKELKNPGIKELKINEVYEALYNLAITSGAGSVEKKVGILSKLLQNSDPLSVRYIIRITLAKLRLGFSDMTILDGLSWMVTGNKSERKNIEAAYNVRPDLGFIAKTVKELKNKGIKQLRNLRIKPEIGVPILMARAERLSSGEEIIKKIGRCGVEYKYDGFRIQVHFSKELTNKETPGLFDEDKKSFMRLFSRNLEDVTSMYPDIVKGVVDQIKAKEAIFEGEAIAFNPKTGEYLPFQETVQRKRKYDIGQKSIDIPLKLIVFELLYIDGESLIEKPWEERRRRLEKIFNF
ncbi:hypothetical protein HY030_02705 [Candidatus Gottesmanbacteria bacterium]|nr:hypothetical protein [Candidatus Gottesmanbacteria bacterium]